LSLWLTTDTSANYACSGEKNFRYRNLYIYIYIFTLLHKKLLVCFTPVIPAMAVENSTLIHQVFMQIVRQFFDKIGILFPNGVPF
jgi:hypothetical protein